MGFKDYFGEQEMVEDMEIISEASIWEDKYGEGTKFSISDKIIAQNKSLKKGSTLDKDFGMSIDQLEKMVFTKSLKPLKKTIKVNRGAGVTMYLSGSDGKNYEITGARSFIAGLFNKKSDTESVGTRNDAESIEVVQTAGLYLKDNNIFQECKTFQAPYQKGWLGRADFKNDFISKSANWGKTLIPILKKNKDWKHRNAVTRVIEFCSTPIASDSDVPKLKEHFIAWWNFACLLSGSYKFSKEVNLKKLLGEDFNIISGKINDYYRAESNNESIQKMAEDNIKANTADVIICNAYPDEVIQTVEKMGSKYKVDDKTGIVTSGKVKWMQISLKKAEAGAQLGKVAAYMTKTLDLPSVNQLVGSYITQKKGAKTFRESYISEAGITEFLGGIWDKIKDVSQDVWDKIKDILEGIWGNLISIYRSVKDILFQKHSAPLDILTTFTEFEESVKGMEDSELEEVLSLNEAMDNVADKAQKILTAVDLKRKFIKQVNKYLEDMVSVTNNTPGVFTHVNKIPDNKFKVNSLDHMKRLLANIITFVAITKSAQTFAVGKTNKMKMEKLCDGIAGIYKEAIFGKTPLPIYKVYGSDGKTDGAWHYLGTPENYKRDMTNKLMSSNNLTKLKLMINKIVPFKDSGYYVVAVYLMNGVNEEGENTYINFRADSSGNFAFNLEGTSETTESKVKATLSKLED